MGPPPPLSENVARVFLRELMQVTIENFVSRDQVIATIRAVLPAGQRDDAMVRRVRNQLVCGRYIYRAKTLGYTFTEKTYDLFRSAAL